MPFQLKSYVYSNATLRKNVTFCGAICIKIVYNEIKDTGNSQCLNESLSVLLYSFTEASEQFLKQAFRLRGDWPRRRAITRHNSFLILKGGVRLIVTDVRVRRLTQEGKMRAIVSITLNDKFVVHDVRVIEGNSGLFVAMPSKRTPSGEFRDIAHPISVDARQVIQQSVLEAYSREMNGIAVES